MNLGSCIHGSIVDHMDVYFWTILALTFPVLLAMSLPSLFPSLPVCKTEPMSTTFTNICETHKCFKSSPRDSERKADSKFEVLERVVL